ncbi:nucleotidyltransferase [Bradyrhizobium sp. CCGUVB14]|uniref:SMODS domain-containing nucleotidyltransferase n=1 Tax=Bradyrhizobium sp. CCGUVB14 TaxID=2949628 RepID=UPI0020B21CFD|nr:nucleotidyltransferase [Bradyrhizobium sp. CCGUVB14]MCP3439790.1 nucleotidyltransferase [Bradyrhizobium sp. CCGUVB14]
MATTIAAGFTLLKQNLEITGLQSATVSTRQQRVREAVEKEMTVLSSFLAGSYQRSTMIAPLVNADVDIFIVLDPSYYEKYTPAGLLDRVRTVLLKTYNTGTQISRNGQAVTLTFSDFKVDAVPCYNRQGGGYLIPNSLAGNWISTNPPAHEAHTTASNKAHNGDIVPLIKMIRRWNREINSAFRGFYLELMTIDILNGIRIDDFPSGVRYVLDKGREKVKFKQRDPAGYGDEINPLDNVTTVEDAVSRFTTAYNRAIKAEEYARGGKIEAAYGEWRKIFGDYFPAYG